MIDVNDIWTATDGGKEIIIHYCPNSKTGFSGRKNFRIRSESEDPNPSGTVFKDRKGIWLLQDKGGADTKARNAVDLVMENERLTFPEALKWIAQKFAPQLITDGTPVKTKPQPIIEQAPENVNKIKVITKNEFTPAELQILGYSITEKHCKEMNIQPVEYYITKEKNGKSWIIKSTPDYPIFAITAEGINEIGQWTYAKLYQPLGEIRFMYVGEKPDDCVIGDVKVQRLLNDAWKGKYPMVDELQQIDERLESLIICSGISDSLNIYAAGYHVCFLNSETVELSYKNYSIFKKITKEIFVCYDIDTAGKTATAEMALKFIDIKIIKLPEDLKEFKHRGKPCKDAKDFFMHYRKKNKNKPYKVFQNILKTAKSLQFWMLKTNMKGETLGYDIDNAQLYDFLQANGICKIESNVNPKGFTFNHAIENIIYRIPEEQITSYVNNILIKYLYENPIHYNKQLENAIHRSNQIKLASLEKIQYAKFDMDSFGPDFDFFFFQNTALKITAGEIEQCKLKDIKKYIYNFKIIDHDFRLEQPPFEIAYTQEYSALKNKLKQLTKNSPEWKKAEAEANSIKEENRFTLKINSDFSFLRFMYNTGRIHWQKETAGHTLTDEEQKEHDLCFIAKVCAIGYLLFRYKEESHAYFVYAMETDQGATGELLGGTGKSIILNSIEHCRELLFIDGTKDELTKNEHLFAGVEKGITETVIFEDLDKKTDMRRFLNTITGKMEIRALYKNAEVIPFKEAPKMGGSSNFSLKDIDGAIQRRMWFMAFASYYHYKSKTSKMGEWSPYLEFGKNLLSDYSEAEMNQFYNFMAYCLQTYIKFGEKISPPMLKIEKRNLINNIGENFILWADEWFTDDKLNTLVDRKEALINWKEDPEYGIKNATMKTFTQKMILYCQLREWTYTPSEMLKSPSEIEHRAVRQYRNGENIYCFYIDTTGEPTATPVESSQPAPLEKNDADKFIDRVEDEPPY
jgi:hypothetical protein